MRDDEAELLHAWQRYGVFCGIRARRAGVFLLSCGVRWVGLTGGIGSGKSSVARLLAARGAVIIDSDQLAREVVQPGTPGLQQVVETFGPSVLLPDGSLDRPALGRKVFESPSLRRALEGIVHPLVRALTVSRAAEAPPGTVVINDVPLLIEAGLAPTYEAVIVVFASSETRISRLVRDRGMTRSEALSRMGAQATDEQRHAIGGIEIYNDGTLAKLESQVDAVWDRLVS